MCHTCYHTFMVKTTVYLPEDSKKALGQLAQARKRPEAELIREAIQRFIVDESRPRPRIPLFRSGIPDLAQNVDKYLKGFGE